MLAKVPKRTRFSAVVTRADGSVDDYGVVMDSKWGWFKRWRVGRKIRAMNKARGL